MLPLVPEGTWSRALLTVAFSAGLMACSASAPPEVSLPDDYLGTWYYMGSSGGMTGGGLGDDATGYMIIGADNTIETHAQDGELLETVTFDPELGPSISSSKDEWILDPLSVVPRVVTLHDGGAALNLSDNVYDGFIRHYRRSR